MTIELTDIDHIGIAVDDLDAAVRRYRDVLDIGPTHRERVDDQGVDEVLFSVGSSYIQLVSAFREDSPVASFLARRGPGLHHIAYRVRDVAAALEHLRAEGAELVDETPRRGSRNTRIAFVHPRAMGGVLVELVEEERPVAG
jgi:methylmalonyl-CoA/ethylmalonyl-CoA epimerase